MSTWLCFLQNIKFIQKKNIEIISGKKLYYTIKNSVIMNFILPYGDQSDTIYKRYQHENDNK
ncbi:MAG: hypothetical protein JXB50_07230 [Spirochaetes bacterium]|nr:hypothetical protein [Spirochaetota bacterium]